MTRGTIHRGAHWRRRASQSGSAVLAALGILAVTLVLVGAALSEAGSRFRTSHHSSRWSQAEHAAEAGAELALMSAQKGSWTTDGWPSDPGAVGAAAMANTFTLSTGVPATGPVSASVAVDQVAIDGVAWLRIRSTGRADISGGALAGMDTQDVLLRKLSFRQDRTDGTSVGAAPRATRTLEILAEPLRVSPFTRMLLLNQKLTMSASGEIDSFDSSDPTKSTNKLYDLAKRQSHGDVGVNDTQGLSDLNGSVIRGDVAYSGPAITDTGGVQGTVTTPFTDPTDVVPTPAWTTFNATPTIINNTATLTGSTQASPARYKVSSVSLSVGKTLTLAPHAVGQESYVEIWVTGDFATSGTGQILQQPGVHVTYHIKGNVDVTATSFVNQSNVAANCIVHCITPPTGTPQTVNVWGSGRFIGAINAPAADFTIGGSGDFSGAMIGRTMAITSSAKLHYDEALAGTPDIGFMTTYQLRSWVEAVR